jgi:hypothetical protein
LTYHAQTLNWPAGDARRRASAGCGPKTLRCHALMSGLAQRIGCALMSNWRRFRSARFAALKVGGLCWPASPLSAKRRRRADQCTPLGAGGLRFVPQVRLQDRSFSNQPGWTGVPVDLVSAKVNHFSAIAALAGLVVPSTDIATGTTLPAGAPGGTLTFTWRTPAAISPRN